MQRSPDAFRSWPLVGRDLELATVYGALSARPPRSIVIAGPAGIGKTRLMDDATGTVGALGTSARRIAATRAGAPHPFFALAPLLGDGEIPHTPIDAVRIVRDALAAGSSGGDSLLVVDDIQWLDPSSAAVVHQLVVDGWCALVATLRTGEPVPEPVQQLWKDGWVERLDLGPLDRTAVAELATAALGGPIDGRAAHVLADTAQGNVLFVREWLLATIAADAWQQDSGIWLLTRHVDMPSRLTELVLHRLEQLSEPARGALDTLALGERVPVTSLERLHGLTALDELERNGLVNVDVRRDETGGTVSIAHPIIGEAVAASMGVAARSRTLRALADSVDTADGIGVLDIVRWRRLAGSDVPGDELLAAARIALSRGDREEADALCDEAFRAGAGWDATMLAADIAILRMHVDRADALLDTALSTATTPAQLVHAAYGSAYHRTMNLGRYDEAVELLDRTAAALDGDERLDFAGRTAMVHVLAGHPRRGLDHALAAMSLTAPSSGAAYAAALASAVLGRSADDHVDRFLRNGGGRMLNRPAEAVHAYRSLARTDTGALDAAVIDAVAAYEVAVQTGDREGQATAALIHGRALLAIGLVADALARFREAVAVNRQLGDTLALRWSLGGTAIAASWAGDAEQAREAATEVAAITSGVPILEADLVLRGLAWTTVADGELSNGREQLRAAAEAARSHDQIAAEALLRHDLVRLGDAAAQVDRLTELAAEMDGALAPLRATHAAAAAASDPDALEDVARRFEEHGALLVAAEAWIDAARLHRRDGATRPATAAASKGAELAAQCAGARTPGLALPNEPTPLTPREREIALLAASGRPSKEIAAKLYLSPRTVDTHLQRVYVKIGVSSRDELARAMA